LVRTDAEQPKIMSFLREIIDKHKNINITPLVVMKGTKENNEPLIQTTHEETIDNITSFF